jgi:tRNA dimethylallyltransferase
MFKAGVVQEVNNFTKINLDKVFAANKIIGIKEIKDYLEKKKSLNETKEVIKLKTRQYAKRQFTWARGNMKSWHMIYSSDLNDLFRKAINKIS